MQNYKDIKLVEFNGYDDDGIDTGELLDWLTSVGHHQTQKDTK